MTTAASRRPPGACRKCDKPAPGRVAASPARAFGANTAAMTGTPTHNPAPPRWRLAAEFGLFFLVAPLLMAVALPPRWMFPMLFAFAAAGLILLHATPGFRWRELAGGMARVNWLWLGLVGLATFLAGLWVMREYVPPRLWFLARRNPELMAMIALLYPFLSALPQEIVFRVLYFRRYGRLLPAARGAGILLNALVFAWAHLMYWSWIVLVMTFLGGLAFAVSYRLRGSFPEAVLAHAIAGLVLFALGLGAFFYSGNVRRPF